MGGREGQRHRKMLKPRLLEKHLLGNQDCQLGEIKHKQRMGTNSYHVVKGVRSGARLLGFRSFLSLTSCVTLDKLLITSLPFSFPICKVGTVLPSREIVVKIE